VALDEREFRLRTALGRPLGRAYEHIVIDCPPSLGLLTLNGLVGAHGVLVPLQCEFFALEGISQLVRTMERVKKGLNPALSLQGIVLTMFDRRNNLSELVAADARSFFGNAVYHTVIPRNVRVSEAPSHGKPVLLYDGRSPGALAYQQLAQEFLQREGAVTA
jgi:chromosome partitioning protein